MKRNIFFFMIIVVIIIIPFVSANLGVYKQNSCVNIRTILNTSAVNISTISYPNSTVLAVNSAMVKNGVSFNYSFCNTSDTGIYIYDYYDASGNTYVNSFEVTSTGGSSSVGTAIFYLITLVFMISLIVIFSLIFFSYDSFPVRIGMIGAIYLSMLLTIFVLWQMSIDFLTNTSFIPKATFNIFIVLCAIALPLFLGSFVWYILQFRKIKEIDNLVMRGYSYDEAEERNNRRRR
jgi:hypothetical protein